MKIESLLPEEFEKLLKAEDSLLLSEIYDRCLPRAIAKIAGYTGGKFSFEVIEEDYNDCFMTLMDGIRLGTYSFNHVNKVCAFLSMCVLNKRRNRARTREGKDDANTSSLDEQYNIADENTSNEESSNMSVLFNELFDEKILTYEDNQFEEDNLDLIKIVMEQLDNLGDPCKAILEYRYTSGLVLKDLTGELNMQYAAIRQRVKPCSKQLRQLVKDALKI